MAEAVRSASRQLRQMKAERPVDRDYRAPTRYARDSLPRPQALEESLWLRA